MRGRGKVPEWPAHWRAVETDKSGHGVTAARVERLHSGGFFLHMRNPRGEYDVWLETEHDVVVSLRDFVFACSEGMGLS